MFFPSVSLFQYTRHDLLHYNGSLTVLHRYMYLRFTVNKWKHHDVYQSSSTLGASWQGSVKQYSYSSTDKVIHKLGLAPLGAPGVVQQPRHEPYFMMFDDSSPVCNTSPNRPGY